ncbi:MAG: YicC/YloC family endoribonuclease [Chlamydiota bacterium]
MTKSMTAYGRATVATSAGNIRIEIQSVNRKGLDISVQLPKEWLFLEVPLRRRIARSASRGYVALRLSLIAEKAGCKPLSDLKTLKKVQQQWSEIASSLGYDPKQAFSFEWLIAEALSTPVTLDETTERTLAEEVLAGLESALTAWIAMKETEGNHLIKAMLPPLEAIEKATATIAKIASAEPARYREKLKARLEELQALNEVDEERLAREVVLFADKIDISEEIDRLRSHCAQFHTYLISSQSQVGKELGFLVQEMLREANTCGSKLQGLEAIQLTLKIKSELEKIREQLQNLE